MLQAKKNTKQKRNTTGGALLKNQQPCTVPPALLTPGQTLSCVSAWRTHSAAERKKQKQTNRDKQDRKCTVPPVLPTSGQTITCVSAWRIHFDVERKEQKRTKHDKQERKRTARNQAAMYPPPSLRRAQLYHVRLAHPLSGMRCYHCHLRFVRYNAASPMPLSYAASSRTPK